MLVVAAWNKEFGTKSVQAPSLAALERGLSAPGRPLSGPGPCAYSHT